MGVVRSEEPSPNLIHFGTAGRHPSRGEAGYHGLMFERKVWAGDKNLGVTDIQMALKSRD